MAYITLRVCDFCGKRIDKFRGTLTLTLYAKDHNNNPSNKSIWSKSCCDKCFKRLCSARSVGDIIKEELNEHIDKKKLRLTNSSDLLRYTEHNND